MIGGYQVRTDVLRELSATLQTQADHLRVPSVDGRAIDAGRSSGEVDDALRHLSQAGKDLSELCRYLSEKLRDCATAYERAEATASADAKQLPRDGRVP